MTTQVLATPVSDIVLVVVNPAWSLDPVMIASGHTVVPGSVLSINEDGRYIPFDPDFPASAVAYQKVDATAAHMPCTVLSRGGCVDVNGLVWATGIDDSVKSVAIAHLNTLGIVARTAL